MPCVTHALWMRMSCGGKSERFWTGVAWSGVLPDCMVVYHCHQQRQGLVFVAWLLMDWSICLNA